MVFSRFIGGMLCVAALSASMNVLPTSASEKPTIFVEGFVTQQNSGRFVDALFDMIDDIGCFDVTIALNEVKEDEAFPPDDFRAIVETISGRRTLRVNIEGGEEKLPDGYVQRPDIELYVEAFEIRGDQARVSGAFGFESGKCRGSCVVFFFKSADRARCNLLAPNIRRVVLN